MHKLDPRTKLVLVILYIVALFLAKWFVSYLLVCGVSGRGHLDLEDPSVTSSSRASSRCC